MRAGGEATGIAREIGGEWLSGVGGDGDGGVEFQGRFRLVRGERNGIRSGCATRNVQAALRTVADADPSMSGVLHISVQSPRFFAWTRCFVSFVFQDVRGRLILLF